MYHYTKILFTPDKNLLDILKGNNNILQKREPKGYSYCGGALEFFFFIENHV